MVRKSSIFSVMCSVALGGALAAEPPSPQEFSAGQRRKTASAPERRAERDADPKSGAIRPPTVRKAKGNKPQLSEGQQAMLIKTLGGRQFWGDICFFQGWSVQRNVFTGHCRLLDENDYRHCWGSQEHCLERLDEIRKERKLPPMKGKAVVVIHGIIRSSKSFLPMKGALENAGYSVFAFDYPSTQVPIPEAAEYLASCLKSLEGIDEINFVVHSMGGLVVRAYLKEHSDERIRRMVMMGVPNNGAEMADMLRRNPLFKAIYGPAGQQLVTDKNGLIASLPVPDFEFAILAGARGTPTGFNPLIPGDDDGTVRVESARLAGAADFGTVKCLHSFLMNDPAAIDQTVRFLNEGRLREKGERQPIPKPEPASSQPVSMPQERKQPARS